MTQPLLLNASPLPDIPWQDRPAGCSDVVWRYDANPIIPRDATPTSNSVFNSAVVPFGDGYAGDRFAGDRFAGVFRCDDRARRMDIHAGFSGMA